MFKTTIVALFLAVASANPIDDAYASEKQFFKEQENKNAAAERKHQRSLQSYAQHDADLEGINTSSFSAMLNGANDQPEFINMPVAKNSTAALPQKKAEQTWSYGALKSYADTDQILDGSGNVTEDGLYGLGGSNQQLL